MPGSRGLKQSLDDAMLAFRVTDFSGGLNSEMDALDLSENSSPDCQNVKITKPGRLIGRDGYTVRITDYTDKPDGIAFFYDATGTRRLVLWKGGNIYDVTGHTLSLIASSVYESGRRVCSVALNGKLYYSDGYTIANGGIRYWDGTTEGPLVSSSPGTGGVIFTPACKVMTSYAGSLVIGNVRYQEDGSTAPHAFLWSDVNDPTTIRGTSIQQVGQGYGGEINCILPLAVASTGVSPFRALIVGKSQFGLYGYSGALSSDTDGLEEFLINCPAGVKDGETMRYIPGPDGSGYVVFLGTDNKVWAVNGTSAVELSGNIRTELNRYVQLRIEASANQRITSVVNSNDFQYILDVGGRQYVYQYDLKTWTRYSGWPSGHWVEARDQFGNYVLYVADRGGATLSQCNYGTTDNGAAISPYWKTPYIHCGDRNILKTWQWIYVAWRTDDGNVVVTTTPNMERGDASTKTLVPDTSGSTTDDLIWDTGDWDEHNWAYATVDTFLPYRQKARLTYQPTGVEYKELVRGTDVTITLSTSSTDSHFEILGFTLLYLPRGRKRVAPL